MVDRMAIESADSCLVENVRLELTKGCLQSIHAPLRIPRSSGAAGWIRTNLLLSFTQALILLSYSGNF